MARIRLTAAFRARWSAILASGDYDTVERAKANQRGEEAHRSGLARAHYFVATRICARWEAAGFSTVRLDNGLPRPERPHPANWQGEGRFKHCGACGRPWFKLPLPAFCRGPSAMDLVMDALARGVPFGLVGGLPTAGVRATEDVRAKLARATCTPMVTRRAA